MKFIIYLRKLTEEGATGVVSSRRFILLLSAASLCSSLMALSIGIVMGVPVSDGTMFAVSGCVAALGGVPYTATERNKSSRKDNQEPPA